MGTTTTISTADDLQRLPRGAHRYELVEGELRTMTPGGAEHGAVGLNVGAELRHHVRTHKLGVVVGAETGFFLSRDPDTVRAPDAAFIATNRIPAGPLTRKYWPGAPTIAVEVVSPDDTVDEVEAKTPQWLDAGTTEVWIVSPRRRSVTIHGRCRNPTVLTVEDVIDGGALLPGFALHVRDVFAA